jgi:hypothetical protein
VLELTGKQLVHESLRDMSIVMVLMTYLTITTRLGEDETSLMAPHMPNIRKHSMTHGLQIEKIEDW